MANPGGYHTDRLLTALCRAAGAPRGHVRERDQPVSLRRHGRRPVLRRHGAGPAREASVGAPARGSAPPALGKTQRRARGGGTAGSVGVGRLPVVWDPLPPGRPSAPPARCPSPCPPHPRLVLPAVLRGRGFGVRPQNFPLAAASRRRGASPPPRTAAALVRGRDRVEAGWVCVCVSWERARPGKNRREKKSRLDSFQKVKQINFASRI